MLHRASLPRLLPVTIIVMAALLGLKSVALVRAAAPSARGAPATAQIGQAPSDAPIAACPPARAESPAERQLLLDLHQRSALIQQRAAALDLRESVLKAAEKKLAERVAELALLQKKLASESAAQQQQNAAKWRALVALYQNMRPRSAAAIFDGLPMAVLLGVMSRMNERKAAPILAAMQPDKARALTARLAALPDGANGGGT
ncbi:MAG: MotE family protein [Acetobacteraceae bacterium]